jgi:hypothetical protein
MIESKSNNISAVLPSDGQQDAYTPSCVSIYPGHAATTTSSIPLGQSVKSATEATDMYGTSTGSPSGYHHYGGWTTAPTSTTPVPMPVAATAAHNYNSNYQGYYHQNPTSSQNYISPAPMVLYPQVFTSTINQNQIHLHLSEEALASSNLTISGNRLEIGVLGEENEQRNDVWRPY